MALSTYISKRVCIITTDGRTLLGTLESHDQQTNVILSSTIERIVRPADDEEANSVVEHGLYLVRGDNITIIGEVDEQLDESIDWMKVKGDVIGSTRHN